MLSVYHPRPSSSCHTFHVSVIVDRNDRAPCDTFVRIRMGCYEHAVTRAFLRPLSVRRMRLCLFPSPSLWSRDFPHHRGRRAGSAHPIVLRSLHTKGSDAFFLLEVFELR